MTAIESWLREILRCPACRSALRDVTGSGGEIELACTGCPLVYGVDDGIPVLLVDEARDRAGSPASDPADATAADVEGTPADSAPSPDGM